MKRGWEGAAFFDASGRHRSVGRVPHVLGLTKDGHPRHPLRLPYSSPIEQWRKE